MLKSYMNLFFFTSKYWFYNVLKVTYFSNVSWAFKTFQSFLLYCSPSNFGVIVTVKLHFHLRFKSIFLQLSFSLACNSLVFLATNNFDLFFLILTKDFPIWYLNCLFITWHIFKCLCNAYTVSRIVPLFLTAYYEYDQKVPLWSFRLLVSCWFRDESDLNYSVKEMHFYSDVSDLRILHCSSSRGKSECLRW